MTVLITLYCYIYRSPRKPLGSPLRPVTTDSNLVFGFDAPSPLTSVTYTNSITTTINGGERNHTHPITVNSTVITSQINGPSEAMIGIQPITQVCDIITH